MKVAAPTDLKIKGAKLNFDWVNLNISCSEHSLAQPPSTLEKTPPAQVLILVSSALVGGRVTRCKGAVKQEDLFGTQRLQRLQEAQRSTGSGR